MPCDEQAVKETRTKASELQSRFDCVDNWDIGREAGFKALSISGQFLRAYDADAFVFIVKAMLPADMKVALYDGLCIRPYPGTVDEYFMVFASEKWPPLPEGAEIPKLKPLILGKYSDNPAWNTHAVYVPEGVECRMVVNKATHTLVIPKDEETESGLVVIARPK